MKNPCSNCIIKSCCTKICKAKETYTEKVLVQLSVFCNEHIYDIFGNPIHYNSTDIIKKKLNKYRDICKINNREISSIILRAPVKGIGLNLNPI
jgi:hypothetical protein